MRRIISLLLIVTLTTMCCGFASADEFIFPSSLKRIEEEAFAAVPAMREIVIPDGVEYLGPRSLDAGLERVYIPDSVTEIADDAIEGATIISSQESYAREYAFRRGLPWENANPASQEEVDDYLHQTPDDADLSDPVPLMDFLTTEGIDDPEVLALIEEFNRAAEDINSDLEEYNAEYDEACRMVNEEISLPGIELDEAEGNRVISLDDSSMMMDSSLAEAMDQGIGISEIRMSEDESYSQVQLSNGVCYDLYSDDTNVIISKSSSTPPESNALYKNGGNNLLDKLTDKLDGFTAWFNGIEVWFSQKIGELVKKADRLERLLNQQTERLSKIADKDTKFTQTLDWEASQNKVRLDKLLKKRNTWLNALKIWKGLDLGSTILSLRQIVARGYEICNIMINCKHPNEFDHLEERSEEMAVQMNKDMKKLLAAYVADGVICIADLWSTASMFLAAIPSGGASLAAKWVTAVIKTALELFLNTFEDNTYASIMEAERVLHTFVEGEVFYHYPSKLPGVTVMIEDGRETVTDENGYYLLHLYDNNVHNLSFSKKDFQDGSQRVQADWGQIIKANYTMTIKNGLVHGTLLNSLNDEPISGVKISDGKYSQTYSDNMGWYGLGFPLYEADIIFERSGFFRETFHVRASDADTPVPLDMKLEPIPGIEITEENFPDENFRNMVRRYDCDGNSVLDGEESSQFRNLKIKSSDDISSIEGIEYLYALRTIELTSSNLTGDFSITGMKELESFTNSSHFSALRISDCPRLESVYCTGSSLATFTIGTCSRLNLLEITDTSVSSLDLSGVPSLKYLDCHGNQLSSLGLTGLTLISLGCSNNQLTSLVFDGSCIESRGAFNCCDNPIVDLDLRSCGMREMLRYKFDQKTASYVYINVGNPGTEMTVTGYFNVSELEWVGDVLNRVTYWVERTYYFNGYSVIRTEDGPPLTEKIYFDQYGRPKN